MNNGNLIWVDCEFTNIDFSIGSIIEIAVIVTDSNLNVLGKPVEFIIHRPQEVLELSSAWTREHIPHVLELSSKSTVTMDQAEQKIMDYVTQFTEKGESPVCGNTVSSDRRMIEKDMPQFAEWLYYRNIDISTLKELAMRWNPEILSGFKKKETHRAMDDIIESIEELKHYRERFIK